MRLILFEYCFLKLSNFPRKKTIFAAILGDVCLNKPVQKETFGYIRRDFVCSTHFVRRNVLQRCEL